MSRDVPEEREVGTRVLEDPQFTQNPKPSALADVLSLSPRQQQAIALLAEGYSTVQVAARLGVSRKTVSRWENDWRFDWILTQVRVEMFLASRMQLFSLAHQAVAVVADALKSPNESIRVRTALEILKGNGVFDGLLPLTDRLSRDGPRLLGRSTTESAHKFFDEFLRRWKEEQGAHSATGHPVTAPPSLP